MKLSKSKLALAKVINENGGWVDGSEICSYNKHIRQCVFYLNGFRAGGFDANPFHNWHQCALSREEYYQAYQKADDGGWIEWKGGKCPVGYDSLVDVRFPDGSEYFNTDADWDWSSTSDTPISHYRPSKKDVNPEFCESVTRSIPEPEAKPTIEQLAHDYRNANDYADRLQQEAYDAKAAADVKFDEIERLMESLGFSVIDVGLKPEAELPITDWRELQVGDVIKCVGDSWLDVVEGKEAVVSGLERKDYKFSRRIRVSLHGGSDWGSDFEFIRRP